jgi:uncharacterized protein YjiS (DUF1127 family)
MRFPAYADFPGQAGFAPAAPAAGRPLVARLVAAFRAWRLKRQTLAEVAALDEATLRDIGINRAQLYAHVQAERIFTLGGGR